MVQYLAMDEASKIREKIDLPSLIGEYIPLKKIGRNFTALCPFHNEKSPSFVVSPERQIWHCFGCGKGGDCFTFLMEYENLEFLEALRILGKKTGIEIKSVSYSGVSQVKDKIFEVNNLASEFYHYVLTSLPQGKVALEYLEKERKINKALIDSFNIGFAPMGNALSNYLTQKKKYKQKDLLDAGLVYQRGSQVFDFFRGRIIFPLTDHRSNVVGFSARILSEDSDGPKYINTRETAVYHKGEMFFALSKAKEEIKKQGLAVIMEGEFDVISAFKEGITNTIAIKGTALTDMQALLLTRFAPKVALCLDQDAAGIEATKRSLPILEKRNLSATVVVVKDAKDPDEALKTNPVGFKKALKDAPGIYDFFIDYFKEKYGVESAEGKKKITDEILPSVALIQNEVIKEHYLKKLSAEIDTSIESLVREVEKITKGIVKEEEKREVKDKAPDRRQLLEGYLLSLIIQADNPRTIYDSILDFLVIYKFESPVFQKIIESLFSYFEKNDSFDSKKFLLTLPKELLPSFDEQFLKPIPKFDDHTKYQEEVSQVSRELRGIYLRSRIKEISDKIRKNVAGSQEEAEKLRQEFAEITSQIS